MDPLLVVDDVSVRYAGLSALSGARLTVNAGEIVSVIGPNGAGKTTLFNAISGFALPTSGRILFRGQEIQGRSPHDIAAMGMRRTFQNGGLFGGLTVLENVLTGLHRRTPSGFLGLLLGLPRADAIERAAVDEARTLLETMGIAHLADRHVRDLSGGQQRIVEIVRTVADRPPLILLDEPAVGLSPAARDHLSTLIQSLSRKDGIGILLIEHATEMVMRISDRVAVFSAGANIAEGTPDEIRANRAVVEAYLGRS
jgi:branched-chain amino acid transport system ATP-binding protein